MPSDPAVAHLGVSLEEQKTEMERSGCHVHSNRVSAGGWLDKQHLAVHTVDDCSVLSRRDVLTHAVAGRDLEATRLSEVSQSQQDRTVQLHLCDVPGAVRSADRSSRSVHSLLSLGRRGPG